MVNLLLGCWFMVQEILFFSWIWYLLLTVTQLTVESFCWGLLWKNELNLRSSHWSCSVKEGFLKIFKSFTEKRLCWNLFLIRFRPLGLQLYLKETPTKAFLVELAKYLRTPILKNICEQQLLKPVLSPGLPFLITYFSGSNWYQCFSFCIIIYSFVC